MDVGMSDDEDSRKRSRSKFVEERDEAGVTPRDNHVVRDDNNRHTSKRPRKDYKRNNNHYNDNTIPPPPSDDFADLLQSYEKQKQTLQSRNQINNENVNNTNHNNKYRNLYNKNNRPKIYNKIKCPPSPTIARITTSEFDQLFSDLSLLPSDLDELAARVASYLQEPNVGLVLSTLTHLGIPETLKFVRMTAEKEEEGGVLTVNLKRQRSPGGTFFFLMKEGVDEEMRKKVFMDVKGKEYKRSQRGNNQRKTIQQLKQGSNNNKDTKPNKKEAKSDNKETNNIANNNKNAAVEIKKEETNEKDKETNDKDTEQTETAQELPADDPILRIIEESLQV